jgi:hypothetical protein
MDAGIVADRAFEPGPPGDGAGGNPGCGCGTTRTLWAADRGLHGGSRRSQSRRPLGTWRANSTERQRTAATGGVSNHPTPYSCRFGGDGESVVHRDEPSIRRSGSVRHLGRGSRAGATGASGGKGVHRQQLVEIDEAELLEPLYRVGCAPDPLAWPPAGISGRYNDPQGSFRVLYTASQRRAAFLETLQVFRPALHDLAQVQSLLPPGDIQLPSPVGRVPTAYFDKRIAAFRLDRTQRWLNLRSPQTHAFLRDVLASELVAAGYRGAFNFGEIIGADYSIT